jgi:hypothetical protein
MQATNVTQAVDLVTALAPAFAAGMAVQRLIEIFDFPVTRVIGEENKKGALGVLSLLVGLGLSYGLGLRVLIHLGVPDSPLVTFLDYFVTGLIVSAGTEGFNSILKFISYKKDEKKAEAVTETVQAEDSLSLSGRLRTVEARLNMPAKTPEDIYKENLQNQVRRLRNDASIVVDFKNGKLNQHTVDDDEAQFVVMTASEDSAEVFDRVLNAKGRKTVRDSIKRNTSYATALGVMDTAVAEGSTPKPEENLV